MSLLVGDISELLAVLPQVCQTDPRLYRYINSAQRQIFLEGQYIGVLGTYAFNVYNSILTLPYEADALLAADIISIPINVQNQWFEFLKSGPGYQDPRRNFTYPDMYDRGEGWCVIQDAPAPFSIQIYCAVPEDPTAVCIIEGLDQYGNQIRSQITIQNPDGTIGGQWINGVQNAIFSAGNAFLETTQLFSKVTGIQLPQRNGDLRLYANARNATTFAPVGTTYLLGIYPYFMTNPSFRRYFFPAAEATGNGIPFNPLPVNALVHRRPLPVNGPNDRLTINNIEALKCYVQACWKDEEEQWDSADRLRSNGKMWLEKELRKTGSAVDRLNFELRGFSQFGRQPGGL